MGKMEEKLVFAVNGERFELSEVDPSTTLLEFLRTRTPYKGAKLGCGEGGCGACVVLLSKYDPKSEQVEEYSISSCLTLLCSLNFCSVTTTEGLGNSKRGFHSIHKRISGFHASQCGFCTPGMCMSIFSALVNADKTTRPEPPSGFSKLSAVEAEKSIAGNICRCTGYRPIVDSSRSFASDVDIEDLGLNTFWSKGENANVDKLPVYSHDGVCTFPEFLKTEIKSSLDSIVSLEAESSWRRPKSVSELFNLLSFGEFSNGSDVKLVVGNTGSGVYKDLDLYAKYIDLRGIPELSVIKRDNEGIEIGAAVTISKVIEVLKDSETLVFTKISEHMAKVASQFIRNTASIGGNLIMAQRSRFPSDIATILLAACSSVCIQTVSERLVLTLEEFLQSRPCDKKTLLLNVKIPHWNSVSNSFSVSNGHTGSMESMILFETYRASPRPLGNAVAYLNSAFLAQISFSKSSGDHILDSLQLAFGAYGSEHAIRAEKVEKFLAGKKVTADVLHEAIRLLRKTIVPETGIPHSSYRTSLAVSFLFKFLYPLAKGFDSDYSKGNINGGDLDQQIRHDLILSSKQVVGLNREYFPVGEPTKKTAAELQASGEAVFVDDIPSPKDCLYGAFIYSTKPWAHVKDIGFKSSLASQKIVTVITAKDIPDGRNNVESMLLGKDRLFADSIAEYAGQPVALVIAESQKFANMAAKQAIIEYGTETREPPILTVEEAIKRSSFFEIPPFLYPKNVGDFSKGMAEADQKILSSEVKLPSQYYFYMETQTALAIPDEDNCMVVYSSNQSPDIAQTVIAQSLGVPHHNVRVITRRVGGGFGGKATKSIIVASVCALAASKLQRPVRMYFDRKTDMIMAGGRHPMKINYSVGFKSDGKFTALHVDLIIDAGNNEDISTLMAHAIVSALKKYNWGTFSVNPKICKTNTPSRSAMRAPGELQGSYIAEAIVEHVASVLKLDANSIRKKNLHTVESLQLYYGVAGDASEYTLPSIFDNLTSSENYLHRVQMIQVFNRVNKWKKRGISCVPLVYQLTLRPTPGRVSILNDGSIVVEVGGIEMGQGLWTKVKQMAAFVLGQLNIDGIQDLFEKVRVVQADTLSLIQGGYTAGSTTSESSCEAVRLACNTLVDRLRLVKDQLTKQLGSIKWDALTAQANLQAVNLSASTYYVPDSSSKSYLNYGAAISEVEIDLLTGATTILRTDITYDCGQSLNPAVDLGQIEGSFVQGIGFFMQEEYLTNSDGLVISDSTWNYKVPTIDTIPKEFNVEILNSGHHQNRVLSSKASGEPPLLLAASVHCATREAIRAARSESGESPSWFQLEVPATMPVVKELCGFDIVEKYLQSSMAPVS